MGVKLCTRRLAPSARLASRLFLFAERLHLDLGDEGGARVELGEVFGQSGDGRQTTLAEQLAAGLGAFRPEKVACNVAGFVQEPMTAAER